MVTRRSHYGSLQKDLRNIVVAVTTLVRIGKECKKEGRKGTERREKTTRGKCKWQMLFLFSSSSLSSYSRPIPLPCSFFLLFFCCCCYSQFRFTYLLHLELQTECFQEIYWFDSNMSGSSKHLLCLLKLKFIHSLNKYLFSSYVIDTILCTAYIQIYPERFVFQ